MKPRAAAVRTGTVREQLTVKLFADGADLARMIELSADQRIRGFTTNPTLMRKAGVRDYREFARQVLTAIPDRPVSFEVLSDEIEEMGRQARAIAAWGPAAVVKIPVTNSRGEPTYDLVHRLSNDGVRINVTAILTIEQIERAALAVRGGAPANISIFAGRIADTGRNPVPVIANAVSMVDGMPGVEIIWASPRELLNVFQADAAGCHIITVTSDILAKLDLIGRDLGVLSLDTVRMFRADTVAAGFTLSESELP
jgi:transaldolase